MELKKTERGFSYIEFVDRYEQVCSLQISSLATERAIWIGIDNANPKILARDANSMQLTQEQVKELLPHLQAFVETGEIEVQEKKSKKYIYNYCVEFSGRSTHASGCITRSTAIESDEDYLQVRECIKAGMKEDLKVEIKNMVIISLTLLNP